MPLVTVILRDGSAREVNVHIGDSLMRAIRDADILELEALCGGSSSCGTCHVYTQFDPNATPIFSPPSSDEISLLEMSDHFNATSRLACQLVVKENLGNLSFVIAPED